MSAEQAVAPMHVEPTRAERTRARPEDVELIERTRAALALIDSKWSVDVIVLLARGIRRHGRLLDNIPGISKKALTATLRRLERHGLVARRVHAEIPVRIEYRLTPLGWELTEPLMTLYEWAVEHENALDKAAPDEARSGQVGGRTALAWSGAA
jgi:DNA-binding HxlR family transcriptional regulator